MSPSTGRRWPKRPLVELADNFDAKRVPVREADRKRGPYPYYGASGAVDYVDSYLFDGDYLLIGEDGENLRTRQTPIAFLATGKFWVNNHAHILQGKKDAALTRYLAYAVEASDISGYLSGSTMPKLTQGNLNRLMVPAPPPAMQERIVDVLGSLDGKIALNHRLCATLEAMARALFKSWFVDFEPVRAKAAREKTGLTKTIEEKFPTKIIETKQGDLPEGWKFGSVYEISDVVYGAPFSSSQFNTSGEGKPLVRIRDLPGEKPGVWTPEVHPKGRTIKPGNIVVGMDGEFRAYLWGGHEAWLNQRVCLFDPRPKFSCAFVRNSILAPLAEVEATETATTVIHLGKNDIDRFQVVIPSDEVLQEFNGICQPWYDLIVARKQETRLLNEQRDALVPKLLSGQLTLGVE